MMPYLLISFVFSLLSALLILPSILLLIVIYLLGGACGVAPDPLFFGILIFLFVIFAFMAFYFSWRETFKLKYIKKRFLYPTKKKSIQFVFFYCLSNALWYFFSLLILVPLGLRINDLFEASKSTEEITFGVFLVIVLTFIFQFFWLALTIRIAEEFDIIEKKIEKID
jgi:hypothetical protein